MTESLNLLFQTVNKASVLALTWDLLLDIDCFFSPWFIIHADRTWRVPLYKGGGRLRQIHECPQESRSA